MSNTQMTNTQMTNAQTTNQPAYIHIQNARIIDPASGMDRMNTDLFISHGEIAAIGDAPEGFVADETIDATGLIVTAGLVDLAARLREPGFEYRATLESEMDAAVAGGVTRLVCPPDTDPVLDEPALVEMLKHRARRLNQAHVYPLGALTQGLQGKQITEMAELSEAGCVAFSQADAQNTDHLVLLRAMQYAATFGFSVWLRPQDAALAKGGVAHEGELATRQGLNGIPVIAETLAIQTIVSLVKHTGCRVHLCRVSSAEGLALVREAKANGLPISCDVAIHHVHLIDHDIGFFDASCHLIPPLRSDRDRLAIRAGLLDGTIDAICSDHTPVDDDAKLLPFAESAVGATGLELLLPLCLQWARETKTPLVDALAHINHRPAHLLNLRAGTLSVGMHADLCVFDPDAEWEVSTKTLKSQGRNTPYFGKRLIGQIKYTFVAGRCVYQAH